MKVTRAIQIPKSSAVVSEKVLTHDPNKCSGCQQCMIGCSNRHYKAFDFNLSLLYVKEDPQQPGHFINSHCSHCVFPACEAVCPSDAIFKDEFGIVRISPLKCIGCRMCNYACPISIPKLDTERNISVKCDLCDGDPYCVKMCSTKALKFLPREEAYSLISDLRRNQREH